MTESEFNEACAPHRLRMAQAREIIASVASGHGVSVAEIMGDARVKNVVAARREAMARVSIECGLGPSDVGRIFQRDHSTIIHALKMLRKELMEKAA